MTISYSGNFCRLLARWKGSVWRLVWKELTVFLFLYYVIRLFYTRLLPVFENGRFYQEQFETLAIMLDDSTKRLPLTFLLGFYVSNIVTRWWRQFECLPWPEDLLSVLSMVIPGKDEKSQMRRHAVARYLNLSSALVWREISSKIRRRYPTVHHLVESGLLTEKEYKLLDQISSEVKNVRWMAPLHWVQQIVLDEMKDGSPPIALINQFVNELRQYRASLRKLFCHDWVCVPLVYTQVTSIATYAYFGFCLIARQYLNPAKHYKYYEADFVLPLYTIVQFLFFVGWFKVGQDLMRPFGMDDDDIELDYIFERNVAASFAVVNRLQMLDYVPLEGDAFWGKDIQCLPHTGLSCQTKQHRPVRHVRSYQPLNREDLEDGKARCARVVKNWKGYDEIMW